MELARTAVGLGPLLGAQPGALAGRLSDPARATLAHPISVAMDAGRRGTARVRLPLSAIDPPLFLEEARLLTAVRLKAPWSRRDGGSVGFRLVEQGLGGTLELVAEDIEIGAWVQRPATFELETRHRDTRTLELSVPAMNTDFSVCERRGTRDEIFRTELLLVAARARLTEVDARRTQLRAALAVARPSVWALAAEFPGRGADLELLSGRLLEQSNAQGKAEKRVTDLRTVISLLDAEPALSELQRAVSTHPLRDELANLEPALAALDDEVAGLISEIQRRAQEAGLEDVLLARADFFLGQYPQSGIEGTFEHLLRQTAATGPSGLSPAEARVQELTVRLAALNAQLRWLDHQPVTHQLATSY